jgi:hypothetical protein
MWRVQMHNNLAGELKGRFHLGDSDKGKNINWVCPHHATLDLIASNPYRKADLLEQIIFPTPALLTPI